MGSFSAVRSEENKVRTKNSSAGGECQFCIFAQLINPKALCKKAREARAGG